MALPRDPLLEQVASLVSIGQSAVLSPLESASGGARLLRPPHPFRQRDNPSGMSPGRSDHPHGGGRVFDRCAKAVRRDVEMLPGERDQFVKSEIVRTLHVREPRRCETQQ